MRAVRKEDVLGALDQIASKLTARAGESLTTAKKYDTPIFEATTPSMEALRVYTLGQKKAYGGDTAAALLFFLRAVELDPNFPLAYTSLSLVYSIRQEPERAAQASRKAYELRDRVPELERQVIEVNYYVLATGELEKAEQLLIVLKQTFPGAPQPHTNLGGIYRRLGNPQKALEEAAEALRREPTNPLNYQNLGADYVSLNRLDEADALYKQAEARGLVNEGSARSRYLLAFLKGDETKMAQFASSTVGKQADEDSMLAAQADTAAWFGKLKDARDLTRRAIESAHRNDVQETAAAYQAEIALFEADSGNRQQSRADAGAAMKLAPTRIVRPMAALALARSGNTAAAGKLANELDKSFPLGAVVQRYWLPAIRAAVALQHKDPNRAIEFLQVASAVELSSPRLLPAYLRGEAYLMLHDGSRAAAEFQKFLACRGLVRDSPWGTLARLGLARAFAIQGNTMKAQAAYRDFLTLWKDADPNIPILKEAKAELTKLQELRHPSFK